jgi:hypothetical protein
MHLSVSGLLYSSTPAIRASCAVPLSTRQHPAQICKSQSTIDNGKNNILTLLPKQIIILPDPRNPAHLTEDQHMGSFLLHFSEEFPKDDHPSQVLDKVHVIFIRRVSFPQHNMSGEDGRDERCSPRGIGDKWVCGAM